MDADIDSLPVDDAAWLLWVGEGLVFGGCVHKFVLAARTCVFAPEPLEVDGTDVASSTLEPKESVNLVEVFEGGLVVVATAAA